MMGDLPTDRDYLIIKKIYGAIGVVVLLSSIVGNIISIGYNIRKVDDVYEKVVVLDSKIVKLETSGSIPAQLTAKDIAWLSENIKQFQAQIDRLERKIDRHMSNDGK